MLDEFFPYLITTPLSFPIFCLIPIIQLSRYKCPPHFSTTIDIASSKLFLTILAELFPSISDIVVNGVSVSQAILKWSKASLQFLLSTYEFTITYFDESFHK